MKRPGAGAEQPDMNAADLYREEVFTDRRVGSIRRLTPVSPDGATDAKRAAIYVGQAQIMTEMGALPLSFEIEAGSLGEAAANFSQAASGAIEHAAKEIQDMHRQASSSIVTPDMAGPGGIPRGKIQMP